MGVYALTQGVPTILPYEYPPFIDLTQVNLSQDDVKLWRISLVAINGDENDPNAYEVLDGLDYKTFWSVCLKTNPKNLTVIICL